MSNVNGRDDNGNPIIWGVSHLDGVTPVQVKFDPGTRVMKVDDSTTIAFDPEIDAGVVPSNVNFAKATASTTTGIFVANETTRPWVVHATTGAVLVDPI